MGYTAIRSEFYGIASQIRYFIPLDENLEIWELTLYEHAQPGSLSVRLFCPSSSACGTPG